MLIAHLPVGVLSALCAERVLRAPLPKPAWVALLLGSVAPDFDMIRFVVDGGRVHHHDYWSHRPLVWMALVALSIGVVVLRRAPWRTSSAMLGVLFCSQGLLHLFLDTFQGQIAWGWPWRTAGAPWVHVDVVPGQHWVLTFVRHWFFQLEVLLIASAGWGLWRRRRYTTGQP